MVRPTADEQQGHIAGHTSVLFLIWIIEPSTRAPAMAGGSRSGVRPTVLPVGLHKTAFTHLGGSFFAGRLTGLGASARHASPFIITLLSGAIESP